MMAACFVYTADMTRQDLEQAEALFASNNLAGCIQLLEDKAERFDRQAWNLRKRVRQRIREGAPPPTENIALAQRLAVHLFNDVCGWYIEGPGGIEWAESVAEG